MFLQTRQLKRLIRIRFSRLSTSTRILIASELKQLTSMHRRASGAVHLTVGTSTSSKTTLNNLRTAIPMEKVLRRVVLARKWEMEREEEVGQLLCLAEPFTQESGETE